MQARIEEYRKKKGLSQAQLAKKLSIRQQTISSYESGRTSPKPYLMQQIAEALDTTVTELFFSESANPPKKRKRK